MKIFSFNRVHSDEDLSTLELIIIRVARQELFKQGE